MKKKTVFKAGIVLENSILILYHIHLYTCWIRSRYIMEVDRFKCRRDSSRRRRVNISLIEVETVRYYGDNMFSI